MARLKNNEERRIREITILNLHGQGWTNRKIACALQVSPATVHHYIWRT